MNIFSFDKFLDNFRRINQKMKCGNKEQYGKRD